MEKSFDGLKDALLREQAMNVVSKNLKISIKEHRPKNIQEMSILAGQYLAVRGNTYTFANTDNKPRQNHSGHSIRNNYSQDICC